MEDQKIIKLRLESTKRSVLCTIISLGLLSFIICSIIAGTVTPNLIDSNTLRIPKCSGINLSSCISEFRFNLINLGVDLKKYNQILYLEMEFESELEVNSHIQLNFTLNSTDSKSIRLIKRVNRNYSVICSKNECNTHRVFYIPYIEHTQYRLTIFLTGAIPVESLILRLKFVTESFTKFIIGVKYFFLSVSIISLANFIIQSKRVPFRFWSIQTKMLGLVGISLIIFNEPFIAATYEIPSFGWSGFSVFSNIQFAVVLLLYWVSSLQQGASKNFQVIAIIIETTALIIIFSLLFVIYLYITINLRFDPTYDWESDLSTNHRGFFITFMTFFVTFAAWTAGLLIWSLTKLNASDLREKIFKVSNALMMILTFIGIGIGSFQPIPRTSALLLLSVALINIYFSICLWLYTPSHNSYLIYLQQSAISLDMKEKVDTSQSIITENKI